MAKHNKLQVPQIYLGSKKEAVSKAPLIYTGLDKFLHGKELAWFHLAVTMDRRKWTNFWTDKCVSLGPGKSRPQTSCTLSCLKIRPVPPVPCKRKVKPDPCKWGLVFSKGHLLQPPCKEVHICPRPPLQDVDQLTNKRMFTYEIKSFEDK